MEAIRNVRKRFAEHREPHAASFAANDQAFQNDMNQKDSQRVSSKD